MAIKIDATVKSLQNRIMAVNFEDAVYHEFNHVVDDVINERIDAGLLWQYMIQESFSNLDKYKILNKLKDPEEKSRLKEFLKAAAPSRLKMFLGKMINLSDNCESVGLVNPKELNINPFDFIETFYYDDINKIFKSYLKPGKIIIRIFYSLDHTLGRGSEGIIHIALMGIARKITDDENLPLKKQYTPITDKYGNLIVSSNIMVAKNPHQQSEKSGVNSNVDNRRHQIGSINLRDLTLPRFYTEESKKTLPGLWSLPKFTDFGKDKRLYYEYINGVSLHEILTEDRFDVLAKLIAIKHIAQALAYMHSAGYVHNDVKPQNILISNKGIATIIDFGLTVKYIESYKSLDDPMQKKIVGTPFFISPEQITKKSSAHKAISEIHLAAPVKSQDEFAFLRREHPESIVRIDGIEFKMVDNKYIGDRTPFFYDSYLKDNFFSDETGRVIPVTGKSDVFSLGVILLLSTTGISHIENPGNTELLFKKIPKGKFNLNGIKDRLPPPLNISRNDIDDSYKSELETLIKKSLDIQPRKRPCAKIMAEKLKNIVHLYFGDDNTFFNTFDDECTYLKNRLFR